MRRITVFDWGIFGIMATIALICTGCGGGDDDSSADPAVNPPAQVAPRAINGQRLTLNETGAAARPIEFSQTGSSWQERREQGVVQGTYEYIPTSEVAASITLTAADGSAVTSFLQFSTANSGTFTFSGASSGSGTFTLGPTVTPQDPPDPGGGTLGKAPSTLNGRALSGTRTFTSTGASGQTHVYTFNATTFHDSDPPEESDGTYTWRANGDEGSLVLNYNSPEEFSGDRHELELSFAREDGGTFTSTYIRRDSTAIVINGDFEIR
jgi:hypothetical protein